VKDEFMSFLAGVLEEFRRRGEIKVEDSRRAAEHFIGMPRDDLHLRVVARAAAAAGRCRG
jgi:hypothetical protein